MDAAQRFLEAKERRPMGSEDWAHTTAMAFQMLIQKDCGEVAKPEWWNDEGLLALSAKVVRAAPNDEASHGMRAIVLGGQCHVLESGTRSAAELKKAATHWERAVALCKAPAVKAQYAGYAVHCRILAADAM